MKNPIFLLLLLFILTACEFSTSTTKTKNSVGLADTKTQKDPEESKKQINKLLEVWHNDAAEANFESYFNSMTKDGIFIGTDATENWNITQFQEFSKPYFDRGSAWDFSTLERNIYIYENGEIAWFDELLDTWMGICRGSGVVTNENGEWKIKHYVLSVTVPNDDINKVVAAKKERDSILTLKYHSSN